MIYEVHEGRIASDLRALIYADPARNYFICMAAEEGMRAYRAIYVLKYQKRLALGLFYRKSGNLQVAIDRELFKLYKGASTHLRSLEEKLSQIPFKEMIVPESTFAHLAAFMGETTERQGAKLFKLKGDSEGQIKLDEVVPILAESLYEVDALYKRVFSGSASLAYMESKLISGRGIARGIWKDGKLVSVAQTDFDNRIIVGVATAPEYQGRGFAKACVKAILADAGGGDIYLQADDLRAIGLYKSLGFEAFDTVLHVTKSR